MSRTNAAIDMKTALIALEDIAMLLGTEVMKQEIVAPAVPPFARRDRTSGYQVAERFVSIDLFANRIPQRLEVSCAKREVEVVGLVVALVELMTLHERIGRRDSIHQRAHAFDFQTRRTMRLDLDTDRLHSRSQHSARHRRRADWRQAADPPRKRSASGGVSRSSDGTS